MKITRRPMLTTILYGLLCGISFVPTVMVLSSFLYWSTAFRLAIWLSLAGYLVILTKWGRASFLSTVFPLLLLLLLVFWAAEDTCCRVCTLSGWWSSGSILHPSLRSDLGVSGVDVLPGSISLFRLFQGYW